VEEPEQPVDDPPLADAPLRRSTAWRHVRRGVVLAVTAVSLYIVFPSLLTVFNAWPQLGDVQPWWFVVVVLLEVASFASLWLLLRVAFRTRTWFDVASSQLASNAASRIVPGGAASGSVVQASMLIGSGYPPASVGAALGATGLLTTGMLLALPALALPAVVTGGPLAPQLELGLIVSLVVALLLVALGFAVLKWDRVVNAVARAIGFLTALLHRRSDKHAVASRIIAERDAVAAAFSGRWLQALASAAGNRMFDYATLVAALLAVGAHIRPSLVLVAYVGAVALGLVPITPGGLGFVETGLTSLLVLAGVPTDQALAGTLLYRLASYWLPIPLGAVAWAGWRAHPAARRSQPST
jgi:putative heme transporter